MEFRVEFDGLQDLLNTVDKMASRSGAKMRKVRQLNLKAAAKGVQPYRSQIVRGGVVRIRRTGPSSPRYEGGQKGPAQDIKSGTLWRSIKVHAPKDGTNVWLGPRSRTIFQKKGMKQVNSSDSWFAHIVDQGQERFGPGRNRGFGARGIKAANAKVLPYLKHLHLNYLKAQWK